MTKYSDHLVSLKIRSSVEETARCLFIIRNGISQQTETDGLIWQEKLCRHYTGIPAAQPVVCAVRIKGRSGGK